VILALAFSTAAHCVVALDAYMITQVVHARGFLMYIHRTCTFARRTAGSGKGRSSSSRSRPGYLRAHLRSLWYRPRRESRRSPSSSFCFLCVRLSIHVCMNTRTYVLEICTRRTPQCPPYHFHPLLKLQCLTCTYARSRVLLTHTSIGRGLADSADLTNGA